MKYQIFKRDRRLKKPKQNQNYYGVHTTRRYQINMKYLYGTVKAFRLRVKQFIHTRKHELTFSW